MSSRDILTSYAGSERFTNSIYRRGWRGALKLGASITSPSYRCTGRCILGGGVIRSRTARGTFSVGSGSMSGGDILSRYTIR